MNESGKIIKAKNQARNNWLSTKEVRDRLTTKEKGKKQINNSKKKKTNRWQSLCNK